MRAWQVREWGDPESMVWAEAPLPDLVGFGAARPGQARVRNRAVGLNFFDILQVQGKYRVKPAFPFTPGAEISGEGDAVGPGVKRCPLGGYTQAHPEYIRKTQRELERILGEETIGPVVSKRYPLSEAPRAMHDLADRKTLGKAVLEIW